MIIDFQLYLQKKKQQLTKKEFLIILVDWIPPTYGRQLLEWMVTLFCN